jgi:hypothetical protein
VGFFIVHFIVLTNVHLRTSFSDAILRSPLMRED